MIVNGTKDPLRSILCLGQRQNHLLLSGGVPGGIPRSLSVSESYLRAAAELSTSSVQAGRGPGFNAALFENFKFSAAFSMAGEKQEKAAEEKDTATTGALSGQFRR